MGAQTGVAQLWWGNVVTIAVGIAMILVAIIKKYEPLLLVGIEASNWHHLQCDRLSHLARRTVQLCLSRRQTADLPPLIFFGVGAMTDFGPMMANPKLVILGAAAHLGIFVALIGAKVLGFTIYEAGALDNPGGADGPMAIFMAVKLAPHLLPQISVAAHPAMALMPLIQPPVMRLFTTRQERMIRMKQMRRHPRGAHRLSHRHWHSGQPAAAAGRPADHHADAGQLV